jgi:hypothetical protein
MAKTRLAILYGGRSAEHQVSVVSARSVMEALDRDRFEVVPIAITRDGAWLLPDRSPLELTASAGTLPEVDEETFLRVLTGVGNFKNTKSLLGVKDTAPYGWLGTSPTLEDRVIIYANATVLGGSTTIAQPGGAARVVVVDEDGTVEAEYPALVNVVTMGQADRTVAWVGPDHRVRVLESGTDDPVTMAEVPMPGEGIGSVDATGEGSGSTSAPFVSVPASSRVVRAHGNAVRPAGYRNPRVSAKSGPP